MNHKRSRAEPLLDSCPIPASTPGWLRDTQQAARRSLRARGLPLRGCPDWQHTDPGSIYRKSWRAAFSEEHDLDFLGERIAALRLAGLDARDWVLINGQRVVALSRAGPNGPLLTPLEQMGKTGRRLFGKHLDPRYDFALLNTACLDGGCMLQVPDHGQPEQPVQFFSLAGDLDGGLNGSLGGGASAAPAFHPRKLLLLGKHSNTTIIDNYLGLDEHSSYFANTLTEIHLLDGARLHYYRVQQESDQARHIGHISIRQEQDSLLQLSCISIGAALARSEIHCRLAGPGAELQARGLYLGRNRQHTDQHVHVEHRCPHTRSDMHYRGLLDDRAQGVFTGRVLVHKGAQGIDARQLNANLLLSDKAEADSKPELEIHANDVKCGHGATVARLDEDMLFYLRSRGLGESAARTMLCLAFAGTLIEQLGLAPLQQRLERLLRDRLAPAAGDNAS